MVDALQLELEMKNTANAKASSQVDGVELQVLVSDSCWRPYTQI